MENRHSESLETVITALYPLVILFGIYLVYRGTSSPGGGFQGGAVLAAIFMIRHLIQPDAHIGLNTLKIMEKIFYILISITISLVVLFGTHSFSPELKIAYMTILNFFIAVKVFCGLSIIFFYFAYVEAGDINGIH